MLIFVDLTNGNNNLVLGSGSSPVINDTSNLGPLATNTLLNNGFQSISTSPSPILSQGPGKFYYYRIITWSNCNGKILRNTNIFLKIV